MGNWIAIISFTYPHEAHLAKSLLESEGIEVVIKDELTAQINNFYSNAIGGIKLLVSEFNYDNACRILLESGYLKEHKTETNKFLFRLDRVTSRLPLIGKSIIEVRLVFLITLVLIAIVVPSVLLSLPSTFEELTKKSWCVDEIYYKGQELTPYTLGLKLQSNYTNCSEIMTFRENGDVDFPGINSSGDRARWELRNDSLIITEGLLDGNFVIGDSLQITEDRDTVKKSIYIGKYSLDISNNRIRMQSDSLTIMGKVFRFDYNF